MWVCQQGFPWKSTKFSASLKKLYYAVELPTGTAGLLTMRCAFLVPVCEDYYPLSTCSRQKKEGYCKRNPRGCEKTCGKCGTYDFNIFKYDLPLENITS